MLHFFLQLAKMTLESDTVLMSKVANEVALHSQLVHPCILQVWKLTCWRF